MDINNVQEKFKRIATNGSWELTIDDNLAGWIVIDYQTMATVMQMANDHG